MTQSQKIKKCVFLADREEEKEIIARALKNKRLRIPQKRPTRWGWDRVYMRIYGTLNQIAKLLNETPEQVAQYIANDIYGVCRIQYVKK